MIHSVYEFTSVCGQNFQTEDPDPRVCPECGQSAVVEWKPGDEASRPDQVAS